MWWLETSVCIELRIIKYNVEGAVAQRPTGRVKIELRNRVCCVGGGFPVFRVECKSVKPLCEWCSLQLPMNVCFAKNAGVIRPIHNPISGNALRLISINNDDC